MAPKAAAAAKKAKTPRNPELVPGINRLSRTKMAKHTHFKNKKLGKVVPKAVPAKKETAVAKAPRFYPTDDVARPLPHKKTVRPTKLRSSIKPGQVLILVAGRFRGKRVVFLKQLPSGLLLVTGPYKLNGVPLRRVNQAFCIATKTHVDIGKLALPGKVDDKYFARQAKEAGKQKKDKKTEEEFFNDKSKKPAKKEINKDRIADQKAVDMAILEAVKKVPTLSNYLSSCFTLTRGQYPHELIF